MSIRIWRNDGRAESWAGYAYKVTASGNADRDVAGGKVHQEFPCHWYRFYLNLQFLDNGAGTARVSYSEHPS